MHARIRTVPHTHLKFTCRHLLRFRRRRRVSGSSMCELPWRHPSKLVSPVFASTETLDLGSRAQFRTATKRVYPATRTCVSRRLTSHVASYPKPNHTESVRSVIDTLEIQNLRDGLEKFTSFRTRCKSLLSPLPVLRLTFAQTTVVRYHYPDRSSHFCANRRLDRQAKPTVVVQQDH